MPLRCHFSFFSSPHRSSLGIAHDFVHFKGRVCFLASDLFSELYQEGREEVHDSNSNSSSRNSNSNDSIVVIVMVLLTLVVIIVVIV